jgi:Ca2+-binding RTX toxin-like protein
MRGTRFADFIASLAGHDIIYGFERNDRLFGGNGRDKLYGMAGSDRINGGRHVDALRGGDGDDYLDVGGGGATVREVGNRGNGQRCRDWLVWTLGGESGSDGLNGSWCYDIRYGGDGPDSLYGSLGEDRLYGGDGDDTFYAIESGPAPGIVNKDFIYCGAGFDKATVDHLDVVAATCEDVTIVPPS